MEARPKVLVLGGPAGLHTDFVASISRVRIRASTKTPSAGGVLPMAFGTIVLSPGLDLQLYGVDRDRVEEAANALEDGLIGAVVLVEDEDLEDTHYTVAVLEELGARHLPAILGYAGSVAGPENIGRAFGAEAEWVVAGGRMDREAIKSTLVSLLQTAVSSASVA